MKKLDWTKLSKGGFDDKRRVKHGMKTGKQLFREANERLEKAEQEAAKAKELEPFLKKALLDHMVNRKPLRVLASFKNPTETLNGLTQDEEDDGFYNVSKSINPASIQYIEVMETIPAGIELVFKSLDKQLGQLIFKTSTGKEVAIYDKPAVMFQKAWIKNTGLHGLLFNTHLIQEIEE